MDARIFQLQKKGGISRIYQEILPRICNLDDSLIVELFTTGDTLQFLPLHPNIHEYKFPPIKKILRPQRIFHSPTQKINESLIARKYSSLENPIWHSSYYSSIPNWNGPVVVTVFDMVYEQYPELFYEKFDGLLRERKKRCVQQADIVISISQTTQRDLISYFDLNFDKCIVISPACSSSFKVLDDKEISKAVSHLGPYIFYVGKRSHNKNFFTLIKAFSRWYHMKEIKLIVAGNNPLTKDEITLLTELSINDRIIFLQNPDDVELCYLYNGALAFVYPSLYEGFGIPLLEAMNSNCPIIASRIPSTLEVAQDIPIYFDPLNVDELLAALTQAIEESHVSERVLRGQQIAKEYSWDKTAAETLNVYHSLL